MTGGDLFAAGIIHILDAVFAQHQTPVGLRLLAEIGDNALVNTGSLIKFALPAQTLCPLKLDQFLFVVGIRYSLHTAAIFACGSADTLNDIQVAAAHFTFDDGHDMPSLL